MFKSYLPSKILLAVLIAGILFSVTVSCSSKQSIYLRYKFEHGKTTVYKNVTKVDVKTESENASEQFLEKLEQSATQIDAQTLIERTVNETAGNHAFISLTNRSLGGKMSMGGNETIIAPSEMKSEVIRFKMDASGRILDVNLNEQGNNPELKARKEEQIKMLQQVVLPERKVAPGYKWTENFTTPLGLGTVELFIGGKITYRYTGVEEFNEVECAVIEFSGELQPVGDNQFTQKGSTFNGRMTGKIHFDSASGEIASYVQKFDLEYEAYVGEQNMQQSLIGSPIKIRTNAAINMMTERIKDMDGI
jgi:hypothetical protein